MLGKAGKVAPIACSERHHKSTQAALVELLDTGQRCQMSMLAMLAAYLLALARAALAVRLRQLAKHLAAPQNSARIRQVRHQAAVTPPLALTLRWLALALRQLAFSELTPPLGPRVVSAQALPPLLEATAARTALVQHLMAPRTPCLLPLAQLVSLA